MVRRSNESHQHNWVLGHLQHTPTIDIRLQSFLLSRRSFIPDGTQYKIFCLDPCFPGNADKDHFHLTGSFAGMVFLALTLAAYKASLKANKNAAVITLCVTLGPMPAGILVSIRPFLTATEEKKLD